MTSFPLPSNPQGQTPAESTTPAPAVHGGEAGDWTEQELAEVNAAKVAGLRPYVRCPVCGYQRLLGHYRYLWACDDCAPSPHDELRPSGRVVRSTKGLT